MKRLFVAINLPQDLKNKIEKIVDSLKISVNQCENPRKSVAEIRFLPKENWHLTLVFLGYQPDEAINPILESLKETVKNFPEPTVEFEKIIWAPPNKPARMIWLTGTKETSKNLAAIKTKLEDELVKNNVRFQRENRKYNTHLTLARFQQTRINADIDADSRRLNISVNQHSNQYKSALSLQAQSLDLMESHLKRTGAEYEILTKVDFIQKMY